METHQYVSIKIKIRWINRRTRRTIRTARILCRWFNRSTIPRCSSRHCNRWWSWTWICRISRTLSRTIRETTWIWWTWVKCQCRVEWCQECQDNRCHKWWCHKWWCHSMEWPNSLECHRCSRCLCILILCLITKCLPAKVSNRKCLFKISRWLPNSLKKI